MNEQDLTIEQKREKCLAVMADITAVFRQDYKEALANVEKSERQMQEQQQREKTGGIIRFVLQILLNIFVNHDMPVYLPESGVNSEMENTIMRGKSETQVGYRQLFDLLNMITRQLEGADEAVEKTYDLLKKVTEGVMTTAEVLVQLSNDLGNGMMLFARKLINSLAMDVNDLKKLRLCILKMI